jgi:feruloyl esterase
MRRRPFAIPFAISSCVTILFCASARAGDCDSLAQAKLPQTIIQTAQSVPAGAFTPPVGEPIKQVSAFCRITGVITPSSDSYIRFEVWLPESNWNGKYLGVGNGGFAGVIGYQSMANNVNQGYATAATDTGHQGEAADASWAFHHPEKIIDFGYRGVHLTTTNAKALVKEFYQKSPAHSYFSSCSDGGREALMEAQRFPSDFDGILAGAPANYWTHLVANGIGVSQSLVSPEGYISSLKIPAIHKAALAACDAQDGVKDGIINDPSRCRFDPSVLLCKGVESVSCLTAPQIQSLRALYGGSKDSQGKSIFPGYMPGSEDGWGQWVIGIGPGGSFGYVYLENYFRYMVFDDPRWNILNATISDAIRRADEKTAQALNATNPDLRPFQSRGGKLILYHGWNDQAISPLNTIRYYKAVEKTMGDRTASEFVRLYMVPSMQHCGGGPGPNAFGQSGPAKASGPDSNVFSALEQWVENGKAPMQITATKYAEDISSKGVVMTRPLCPYPELAKFKGSGSTSEAANFTCAAAQ